MRLITWNCSRGPFAKKVPLLASLGPDIAVIQECAKPLAQSDQCLWFGDDPKQGIAVVAYGPYRIRAASSVPDVPRYMVPIEVSGPHNFLLLAVWSKRNADAPYVEAVVRGVEMYREMIEQSPTVLIGDLNSNAIWDRDHPKEMNHSALVRLLAELGQVSAYHHHYGEPHGAETRQTYYFHWNEQKPFHIDYCFIPTLWADRLEEINVGTYSDWKQWSDHRPLLVELRDQVAGTVI